MGALGSDAAIEAADVVLMDGDPAKIALAMRIARRTLRIVHQNIVFALGIKALCLLLGALGIAGMWAAIFADVGVMVIAVLNATRALWTRSSCSQKSCTSRPPGAAKKVTLSPIRYGNLSDLVKLRLKKQTFVHQHIF